MNYGELRLVDELHRLDQVAVELIRWLLDRYLTEPESRRTPAVEDVTNQAGRPMAAGRPGVPKSRIHAGKPEWAIEELTLLLGKEGKTPADMRRVAEILEVLGRDDMAYEAWSLAAKMGDPDAIDYLEILNEEMQLRTPSEMRKLQRLLELKSELDKTLGALGGVFMRKDDAVAFHNLGGSVVRSTAAASWIDELEASLLT
ncbi:hypothetical protein [Streptomyces erythrochromogenes]|uniref:hypothetical protein n=1 Tax=Streptomyces erythrochromogenes TaxID=285574 RepID=UPI0038049DC7